MSKTKKKSDLETSDFVEIIEDHQEGRYKVHRYETMIVVNYSEQISKLRPEFGGPEILVPNKKFEAL